MPHERAPTPSSNPGPYFRILPAHRGKEAPMIDPIPASVPNRPSCKSHREGSDNGYRGWQGVETGGER